MGKNRFAGDEEGARVLVDSSLVLVIDNKVVFVNGTSATGVDEVVAEGAVVLL